MYKMINFSILKMLFWGCMLIYLIIYMKKHYIRTKLNRGSLIFISLISSIHIIIYFYLGFTAGFSKSPYSHKIIPIIKNILVQIIPIIGIETLRMATVTKNKNNKLLVVIITILLIFLQINYNILFDLHSNKEEMFRYICSTVVSIIICNIIYTYFILKNMYLFALSYRVLERLFLLLVPISPNVDWYVIGSSSILLPIFMYLLFKYKFLKEKEDIRKRKENFLGKLNYIITFILSIILVCFMLGLFKYEPICILSNSMIPTYEQGDVVIFKKVSNDELSNIPKNAIIVYTKEDKNIAHRVINVIKVDGSVLYQTKGDSNNTPDTDLVQIEQIKGIYVSHIKYIGFPSVWLYYYFHQK